MSANGSNGVVDGFALGMLVQYERKIEGERAAIDSVSGGVSGRSSSQHGNVAIVNILTFPAVVPQDRGSESR